MCVCMMKNLNDSLLMRRSPITVGSRVEIFPVLLALHVSGCVWVRDMYSVVTASIITRSGP